MSSKTQINKAEAPSGLKSIVDTDWVLAYKYLNEVNLSSNQSSRWNEGIRFYALSKWFGQ